MTKTPKFQYEALRVDYGDVSKISCFFDYLLTNTYPIAQIIPGRSKDRKDEYSNYSQAFHYRNSSLSVGVSVPTSARNNGSVALLFVGLEGTVEEDSNELIAAMVGQGLKRENFSKRRVGIE